ncbi:MAG: 50S ribosomal protein L9 [Gammaproteobacteria bacterium]|jgi:large subunit ribosomal protein L9|nr:50S ribosomal protein L9 [Gammaproteobacteria bacterium]
MDIILLEQVENLGNIGDRVAVKAGYGRNYLLPKGKATLATPENIALFEARRAELEARQADELAAARARAAQLADIVLTIAANAGEEGKLFGSVGTVDIAEACVAAGVEIQRSEVRLPDGPLRTVGAHEVELHLHTELDVSITVNVVSDGIEVVLDEDPAAPAADSTDS